MKKLIAWLLLLTLMVGVFAGCRKTEADPNVTDTTISEADIEGINAAIEYLKGFYKDDGSETPVDYERFGIVRIGGVPYEVVWSVDVSEDLIKIVVNDDGTVTIDVNEECEEDTPYVLTATITDAAGNSVTHSWNHILPKAVDMVAIVKAAYALKPGESLPYESTLRGKITQIKTPYSEEYKNITVVIEVEGAEDMPIECYRLKGEGAEELAVGDIITVTGTLKNYNGTIEFDSGCVLVEVVPGERVEAPDDMKQIVDEAYALGANKTLPYEATLTGEIIEIGTPYDSYYGNITVTIVVEGREDYPIVCYRMKGKGCENLKVTDEITVKGYITNYVGDKGYSTIEFTAGCQLLSYTPGSGVYTPTDPAEIMRIAKALGANKKTKFEATLTGVITKVNSPYSSQYGNVSVTMDVNGTNDEIYCYRIKGNGADVIGVGDTITVKGYITNYVGDSGYSTIEFVAGSKLVSYTKGVKEELPSYNNIIADAPVVGTAYKLGMEQKNNAGSPWYYFDGTMDSYYLGTNEDGRKAVDVYLAEVSGGYNLYFKDASGATKYINIVEVTGTDNKLHVNMQIADKATSVYTFNSEKKVLTTNVGETAYCIGTYNNYTTMAARKLSGCEMPAYLLTLEALTGPASMEEAAKKLQKDYPDGYDADKKLPTEFTIRDDKFSVAWKLETTNEAAVKIENGVVVETSQEQAVNYKLTATITKVGTTETVDVIFNHTVAPIPKDPVKNPAAETAYKLGMNLPDKTVLFTGSLSGSYLATADDSTKAVNVKMEAVSGGYLLYFMDGETKTYICAYETDAENSKASLKLTTEKPAEFFTHDTERNILIYTKGENSYYLGTFGSYDTIGISSTSYITDDNLDVSQYPARFYPENIKVEPAPIIEPDKEVLTIAEVIEFASTVPHNKYTTNMYKVTGVITEVYNTTYGNMYIADADGNKLTIYGTYDATGEVGYKDMEVKPIAGDTITVYGIIGQYNGTPQMKNGWIVDHVAVNPPSTDPETTEPETTEPSEPVSGYVTEVEANKAYKLGVEVEDEVWYITGETGSSAWYLATTKDVSAAADIYLEVADGGYVLYFMNGTTKIYIDLYERTDGEAGAGKGSLQLVTEKPSNALTFDETLATMVLTPDADNSYYLGTYFSTSANKVYDTLSASNTSYITGEGAANIGVTQFVSHLYEVSNSEPDTSEPTTEPSEPASGYVTEVEANKAYKLGVEVEDEVWYITGETGSSAWYLATTKDVSAAADIYLEVADGGYVLYFMNGTTKTYIDLYERTDGEAGAGKGSLQLVTEKPSNALTFDETLATMVLTPDADNSYYLGTYFSTSANKVYDTLSASNTSYITGEGAANIGVTQFVSHLYEISSSEPDTSEPTTEPSEPDTSEPSGSGSSATYVFSNYGPGAQYVEEHYDLDSNVSMVITGCQMNNQLRIYQDANYDGNAVVNSANAITGLSMQAGHKVDTLNVYGSNDNGTTWTLIQAVSITAAGDASDPAGTYLSYEVDFNGASYTSLKFDAANKQIRMVSMTLTFATSSEPEPSEPNTTEPDTTEPDAGEPTPSEPDLSTQEGIVNAAYALEEDASLEGTYTLTGVIASVDNAYSTQFSNVTVTMQVGDMTDKPIVCYRLKGTGADQIGVGDTITVTGTLVNYGGTIEFSSGCTLDSWENTGVDENLTTPEEILTAAYALADGESLQKNYTLTGVITSVDEEYSTQYSNITVTMQVGDMSDKLIMCYRLKGTGADVIKVGDTITVTGGIKNYGGTIEFVSCTLDSYVSA